MESIFSSGRTERVVTPPGDPAPKSTKSLRSYRTEGTPRKALEKIPTVNRAKSTPLFNDGDEGVFFFRYYGDSIYPFHPGCYVPSTSLPLVEALLAMKEDPAPYVNLEEHPEDESLVHMLGTLFSGFEVSCREFPRLERSTNTACR